jgi:Tol biopolymer transport system component
MALTIGSQLGSYEVIALLGKGGMGEVYRARDLKLKREVAIKILPQEFSRDADRVGRFQHEAEVLASLNHPNIANIYDLEEQNGSRYLVLELVEGETLAERIARGSIPIEDTLELAKQICEALEAAHERGIIHRDLKPANVKLTPDGKIKVLDFGLAKAMENTRASTTASNSPTMVSATMGGVILGTAAYMSPEQARGRAADQRSDVFGFGCVLYEMLTGRQTFHGEEVSDVLAAVLKTEPDWNRLPPDLTPKLRDVLRRCLQKDPKRRWHAIADVRLELEAAAADPLTATTNAVAAMPRMPIWKRALPAAVAALVVSVVSGFIVWTLRPASPGNVMRFPFTLPEGQQFTGQTRLMVALSPDGTRIVYAADQRLYMRSMSEIEPQAIPGTDGGANPVFSPDGNWLVFGSSDGTLRKIAVSGGAAVTICKIDQFSGMTWTSSDDILFGSGNRGILRVSAKGGKPETIISVKSSELAYGPQLLPDGKSILFTLAKNTGGNPWENAQIVVQSLNSEQRKIILDGGSDARYLPTGHIIYEHGGNLLAVPFNLRTLDVGTPIAVVEGVARALSFQTGAAQFSVSDSGSLIYVPTAAQVESTESTLAFVDRNGQRRPLALPAGFYRYPRISPDDKRLAFVLGDGKDSNIFIYDLAGTTSMSQLTFGGANDYPLWSADGERVAFQSDREGDNGIFWQRADHSGTAERLTKAEDANHRPDSWPAKSPQFSFSVFQGFFSNQESAVWTLLPQEKKPALFVHVPQSNQIRSFLSPDGRWVVYQSDEARSKFNFEIYVKPYPPSDEKYQITKGGGTNPLWSPDGKEIIYEGRGKLMSVHVVTQPRFSFTNPVELPIKGFIQPTAGGARNYDVTTDGKQFIMAFPVDRATRRSPLQIQVVANWFEELKQRVPVRY